MNSKSQNIKGKFRELLTSKTEEDRIERDAYILMANYLSEIERLYKNSGLNRKELAQKIKISPSYLSQVFGGNKPLNFLTLAKIKRALNLRFNVTASFINENKTEIQPQISIDRLSSLQTQVSGLKPYFSVVKGGLYTAMEKAG